MGIDTTKKPETQFAGVTKKKVGKLKPAIDTIPKSLLKKPTHKGVLIVVRAVTIWILSLAVLTLGNNPFVVAVGWIFASLALAGLFVVGHDAAHGSLFDSKKANKVVARLLFLPELHSYEGWLLGHNRLHHGHTVRDQMDFVWLPTTPQEYKAMSRFEKLRHRVEWSFFGSGIYYIRNVWWNKMISFTPPERYKKKIQRDVLLVLAFGVVSVGLLIATGWLVRGTILHGLWLVTKLIVVPWIGFMTIIGWTVYVHHIAPEIKWWPRSEWDSYKGQIEGTTILRCNPVINWLFFHNIFVHVPHHVDMRIPCYNLVEAGNALMKKFPDIKHDKLKFSKYLKSVKQCKLYDFNEHIWSSYKAHKKNSSLTVSSTTGN